MAFRTSAKLLGITLGVAALAGASQLGLAYGLGVLRLTRVLDLTARDQWTAQLAWVAWFAMTAAVIGGMAGRPHLPKRSGAGTRLVTAVTAGLGAAVVVPLTMQPARTAEVAGVEPVFVIGVCAALGAAAGIFAAYAALSRLVARWSLTTVGAAVWAIAIISVAPSMAPGEALPAVRLGVLDATVLAEPVTQRTALFTMPVIALISGIVLGAAARRRDLSTLTIALSGLAGPALLTVAYLIAGPGSGNDGYQTVPYWAAMTAAGAGVLGSVLAAVLRRAPEATSHNATPNRPPLPKRDAQPESAIAQAAAAPAPEPPAFDGFTPTPNPTTNPAMGTTPAPATSAAAPAIGSATGVATSPPPGPATPPTAGPPSGPRPGPAGNPPPNPAASLGHPTGQFAARPHPHQVSPPLPTPTPMTPMTPPPQARGRRRPEQDGAAEWVSGLGNN
jgi:hypothetical protein